MSATRHYLAEYAQETVPPGYNTDVMNTDNIEFYEPLHRYLGVDESATDDSMTTAVLENGDRVFIKDFGLTTGLDHISKDQYMDRRQVAENYAGPNIAADILLNELGYDEVTVAYDAFASNVMMQEVEGETLADADSWDQESLEKAVAASLLGGNADIRASNFIVNDGRVVPIDYDEFGKSFEAVNSLLGHFQDGYVDSRTNVYEKAKSMAETIDTREFEAEMRANPEVSDIWDVRASNTDDDEFQRDDFLVGSVDTIVENIETVQELSVEELQDLTI